jgi:hypothetical protein
MSLYPFLQPQVSQRHRKKTLLLADLERAVFGSLPVLGQIYERSGSVSLLEFTRKQFYSKKGDLIAEKKKNEVIVAIKGQITRHLSEDAAYRIEQQLKRDFSIITADHHGPLTHPNFLASNLLTHFVFENEANPYDILVLACANISFDTSTFPRGHLFTADNNGTVEQEQLTFFSRKVRPLTVSGHEAYTQESLDTMKQRIITMLQEGKIKKTQAEKLTAVIDEVYADPSVLALKTFSEQITKTNYALWKKIMGEKTNLIYLEQEQVVNNLIVANHLNTETIIGKVMFDETVFDAFVKYFNGVSRGFNMTTRKGTYLFWGTPKDQKYRLQLWKEGNKLVAADGSFSVDLTPAGIKQAIERGELLPSTLLSFMILSFYYGLSLIGGKRQTTYLTKMKIAYTLFCKEIGFTDPIHAETSKQLIALPSIALLTDKNGNVVSANGMDLLLYGDADYKTAMRYMVERTTVAQAIARNLPAIYRSVVAVEKQTEELLSLTVDDIDRITNFTANLKFSGTIA